MTRLDAIKYILNVTENEAFLMLQKTDRNKRPIAKICRVLAKETGVSYSQWKQHSIGNITPSMEKAVRCRAMEKLLQQVSNSPVKLDDAPHAKVSIDIIDIIEEVLR